MEIPKQLQKYRFIKTSNDKRPIEHDWPDKNNYSIHDFDPGNSSTYGVLCGKNNLVVIDCDDKKTQDHLLRHEEFRNTFTVKTAGKGLYHFYFETEKPKTLRIDDNRGKRILDVQGPRTQVIGPNSEIAGNTYTIVNNDEVKTINSNYLYTIITNIDEHLTIKEFQKKGETTEIIDFDDTCKKIKEKLKIKDILPKELTDKNPTKCPLGHTSEGGQSFSYDDVLWHCFHCGQSGNIFHLYQKLHKTTFITAKIQLAEQAGIREEFKHLARSAITDPKERNNIIEQIAQNCKEINHIYTIRNDQAKQIYIYQEGVYKDNGASYIKEYVRNILADKYKESYANQVLEKIMVDTYIEEDKFYRDPPINLIPLENGVYNLQTKKLEEYNPGTRFFNKHPIVYDETIRPEKTLEFIKQITKTQEDIDTIQEIIGYTFYREYKYEKAFMYLGKGRNGKTKLLEVTKTMLGPEACTEVSIKAAEEDHFALAELHKKNANISGDLSNNVIEYTGKFKDLVGRGLVRGDRKFKTPIYFVSYAKMLFATNELPYTKDHSDGFWNRWVFIDFPYKFVPKPDPNNPYERLENPQIIDSLTTQKELTGLFNWAMIGLERLFKNNHFTNNKEANAIRMKWFRESSSVACFFEEEVVKTDNPQDKVSISEFDFVYNQYCISHDVDSDNRTVKNEMLKKLGVSKGKNRDGWFYVGIKLKNVEHNDVEEIKLEELE